MRYLLVILCLAFAPVAKAEGIFVFGHEGLGPQAPAQGILARLHQDLGPLYPKLDLAGQGGGLQGPLPPQDSWRVEGVASALGPSFRRSDLVAVLIAPSLAEVSRPGAMDHAARLIDWVGTQNAAARLIIADPTPEQSASAALRARFPHRDLTFVANPPEGGVEDLSARIMRVLAPAPPPALKPAGSPRLPLALAAPSLQNPAMAMGLAQIADWEVGQPFLDVMKTARPWVGHRRGQWGAMDFAALTAAGALSPEGWPLHIPAGLEAIEVLALVDLPPDARKLAGRYSLRWQGKGNLSVTGRARNIRTEAADHITFDFTPGEGGIGLRVTSVDAANPLRDITLVRADREGLHRLGVLFNPDWLALVRDLRMVRFMDWMQTNNSQQRRWEDRPVVADFSYQRRGVPLEVMLELANHIGADPWFTLPHMADDTYVRNFATLVAEWLNPDLRVHAEWSNEVWNFIFTQAHWAREQALARWQAEGDAWMQFAGLRAAEVADIWTEVFAATPDRLRRVIGVQTGWKGLEQPLLTAPLAQAEGRAAPATSFDSYAVTGYFGHEVGPEEGAQKLLSWLGPPPGDLAAASDRLTKAVAQGSLAELTGDLLPYHAKVARDHDLALMMYEGGTHLVTHGPAVENPQLTDFLIGYNYSPAIATAYDTLLAAWQGLTDQPFNAFVEVSRPSKWGSWGALRDLGDDNPRWQSLQAWNRNAADRMEVRRAPHTFDAAQWHEAVAGQVTQMRPDPRDIGLGGAGDDSFLAFAGQAIDGGAGQDQVHLRGRRQDWQSRTQQGVTLLQSATGVLRLINIEEVVFEDGQRLKL